MGLLSNLLLLSCCLAFFRSKKCYSKSEKDAAYEAGYEYGYDTCNNAKFSSGYQYEYEYYEDLHTGYECNRDSDCLESGRPKCLSGLCQELSGGVLFIGGVVSGSNSANVAKIGECPVNVNNIPQASALGAAAVYDNLVYQCGGSTGSDNTNKCFIRSSSGQWTEGPSLHNSAQGLTLNKVGSTLVAIGGRGGSYFNSVEILHPGSLTWQIEVYTISPARFVHCAVTISSTQVILAGGHDQSNTNLPNTEMLNLNTGFITRYADLPLGLYGHACVLHQGRILLAGGYSSAGASSQVFTLDYSNQGNSWISTSSMVTARFYFSMVVINGVPTAFGGRRAETSMETFEGGVWKSQVFTAPRELHTSVVIC